MFPKNIWGWDHVPGRRHISSLTELASRGHQFPGRVVSADVGAAAIVAYRLRSAGFGLKSIPVMMLEGRIGEDGLFSVAWNGVLVHVDPKGGWLEGGA